MTKKIFIILGMMLSAAMAFGQEIMLSGIVKNAATLEGIKEATVEVKGFSSYNTMTDGTGFYFFMIPETSTTLIVKAKGMQMLEISLTKDTKKMGELNIFMDPKADDEMASMSMEELMNIEVSIATKKSTSIRETPGIVSVITEEQIRNSGARDMIDLIQRYVPGFAFAAPEYSEGVIGLGIRGIMSYQGRFLLLLDGMEANESKFGSVVFGNNYTLENIKKIEIVRGPGSSVYGGYASMGVINITTNHEGDHSGGKASWLQTSTGKGFTHNNISFASKYAKDNFKISFNGVYGNGNRSDRDYHDFFGNTRSLSNASELDIKEMGLRIDYKGFKFSTRVRDYHMTTIDLWDTLHKEKPIPQDFQDWFMNASYNFKIGDYFEIIPDFKFKRQFPWQMYTPEYEYVSRDIAEQIGGGLAVHFEKGIVDIVGGVNYDNEIIRRDKYIHPLEEEFKDGKDKLAYHNFSSYVQGIVSTKFANITAGARWDKSSLFDHSFSPRVGITKAFEWFHLKAAYSQAFRAPGGILLNRSIVDLKPEQSTTIEFEAGVKLPFNFYLTGNLYDIEITNLLNAYEDEAGYLFQNSGNLGVQGAEAVLKHISEKVQAEINFAYYQRKERDGDADYLSPNDSKSYLAFSPIRLNTSITWHITKKIAITPSYSFFGGKNIIADLDNNQDPIYGKEKNRMLLNLYADFRDILIEGLSFGIGGNNLLGEDFKYHVSNLTQHAAIPALDRSIILRLTYEFKNK